MNALGDPDIQSPLEVPSSQEPIEFRHSYDTARAKRILGLEFRSKDVTGRDTIASFKERGWVNRKLNKFSTLGGVLG